ncbi:MAG: hypothetical protein L6Q35_07320 [Phycisphaerales bacterium]|nr:hypothetical protein [Phycisphaerales bacterium]
MACPTQRPVAAATAVGLASLAACLPACVDDNKRITLGHDVALEAFSPERQGILSENPPQPGPNDPAIVPGSTPVPIDRSAWSRQVFMVPVDGTGHRPTYAHAIVLKNDTARQRGEFPNALSALELDAGFTDEQVTETLTTPLVIFGTALAVPIRLFTEPQWLVKYSPKGDYDRWPGGSELTWLRTYQPTDVSPVPVPAAMNPSGEFMGPPGSPSAVAAEEARKAREAEDAATLDEAMPDQPGPEEYPR